MDSHGNALAETINRLYSTEWIYRRAPWNTKEAVEFATLKLLWWLNHHLVLEPFEYLAPTDTEANHYFQIASQSAAVVA